MAYDRHYGEGTKESRRALLDLVEWFGWKKSLLIFRETKKCVTFRQLDGVDMAIAFGGVGGRPVLDLFRRIHGEEAVVKWRTVKKWADDTPIKEG
jgi:hypothetical protein